MGRDKAHLPLPGNERITFVEHLSSLLTAQCSEVVLVARDAMQSTEYCLPGVHIVPDRVPNVGPLMGLYSGLRAIKASHAVVTAVDMPFVQPEMITFLLAQPLEDTLLVPVVNGVPQVLLAVYPRSLLPTIEELLREGRPGPRFLLDVVGVRYIEEAQLRTVDPELRSFINVNTAEEWKQYGEMK